MSADATYEVVARSRGKAVWVFPRHPGMPDLGPFILPDGRDAYDLIANGQTDGLGFVPRLVQTHGDRWGDLLWTGERTKIASRRFLDALAGFSGWHDFEVEVVARKGIAREGYRGFAVHGTGPDSDVWNHTPGQNCWFAVSAPVEEALRECGATELDITRLA